MMSSVVVGLCPKPHGSGLLPRPHAIPVMSRSTLFLVVAALTCDVNVMYFLGPGNTAQQWTSSSSYLDCPQIVTRIPPLNSTCRNDKDCRNRENHVCCPLGRYNFCLPRRTHPMETNKHRPLFGLPRHCPTSDPLQEFLPVKNCTKDLECEPRICCPDGHKSYCRTAVPRLEPRTSESVKVIRNLISYLQCSSPPPPSLDLFPKACKYSFDCFPNICCQEKGKKVCRPPKRSILRFFGSFAYT